MEFVRVLRVLFIAFMVLSGFNTVPRSDDAGRLTFANVLRASAGEKKYGNENCDKGDVSVHLLASFVSGSGGSGSGGVLAYNGVLTST
jgi:hypothetical protein